MIVLYGFLKGGVFANIERLWILLIKGQDFIDQLVQVICLEIELLGDSLSLSLFSREVVTDETNFEAQILGHLGTLLGCTRLEV